MQIKENGEWDECFVVRDVFLPSGHYFGATASTGDLADNHDIVSIKVSAAPAPTEEFLKKTEEYKKANPITSQNVAKRMQEEQKHHMDSNRIQSNHHAASAAEPEEGGVMIYIVIIVVAAGIGAAVYFTQIKKTEDARRCVRAGCHAVLGVWLRGCTVGLGLCQLLAGSAWRDSAAAIVLRCELNHMCACLGLHVSPLCRFSF